MGKHLNQSEKEFILNSADGMTDKTLAEKLTEIRGSKVSKEVIGNFRRKNGLQKTRGRNAKLLVPQASTALAQPGEAVESSVPGEAQETNA